MTETLKSLARKLRDIKTDWEGKSWKDFPYDSFWSVKAEEDNGDTDLYKCSFSEDGSTLAFYVNVAPATQLITDIDLNCVDLITDGEVIDCINLIEKMEAI